MNVLELFAGAGGGVLAHRLMGCRTVCAVEMDAYCRELLLRRQEDGTLEPFPVWDDVRTFDGRAWRGVVDCVSGGFPCQPYSSAGAGRGADDARNLWPDTARIVADVRPAVVTLENVPGLLRFEYFGQIVADLSALGYRVAWATLSAADLGAPHIRDRLWIAAVADAVGDDGADRAMGPDADGWRREAVRLPKRESEVAGARGYEPDGLRGPWGAEPNVGRVADGVAARLDRLRALGNGQVPIVAATAWERLLR